MTTVKSFRARFETHSEKQDLLTPELEPRQLSQPLQRWSFLCGRETPLVMQVSLVRPVSPLLKNSSNRK